MMIDMREAAAKTGAVTANLAAAEGIATIIMSMIMVIGTIATTVIGVTGTLTMTANEAIVRLIVIIIIDIGVDTGIVGIATDHNHRSKAVPQLLLLKHTHHPLPPFML